MLLLCSKADDTVNNDLKEKLQKSEEERRKLVKECAIYQSQLEVCVCVCVCVYFCMRVRVCLCVYVCMGTCIYVCTLDFKAKVFNFQLSHKCQNTDKRPFKPSLKSCDGIRFCFTHYKIPITYSDASVLSKTQNRFSVVWLHP